MTTISRFFSDDPAQTQRLFVQACIELNEITAAAALMLPLGGISASQIDSIHRKWTEQLTHAQNTVARKE